MFAFLAPPNMFVVSLSIGKLKVAFDCFKADV